MLNTDSLYKLAWCEEKPEEHECVFWGVGSRDVGLEMLWRPRPSYYRGLNN